MTAPVHVLISDHKSNVKVFDIWKHQNRSLDRARMSLVEWAEWHFLRKLFLITLFLFLPLFFFFLFVEIIKKLFMLDQDIDTVILKIKA